MTSSISIRLSQSEINEAMRPLISRKLHEAGINITHSVCPMGYFLITVDPPSVVGVTEINCQVDRGGLGTKLTYIFGESR